MSFFVADAAYVAIEFVAATGRLVLPKTDIGDPGAIAIVADLDGNTVGLHSEKHSTDVSGVPGRSTEDVGRFLSLRYIRAARARRSPAKLARWSGGENRQ